jgi:hypothetical protein
VTKAHVDINELRDFISREIAEIETDIHEIKEGGNFDIPDFIKQ